MLYIEVKSNPTLNYLGFLSIHQLETSVFGIIINLRSSNVSKRNIKKMPDFYILFKREPNIWYEKFFKRF